MTHPEQEHHNSHAPHPHDHFDHDHGHSHDSTHGHSHGLVDESVIRSREGVRAVSLSFAVLFIASTKLTD